MLSLHFPSFSMKLYISCTRITTSCSSVVFFRYFDITCSVL
uniref:Uncharacterized protein n=1 Tax=Setaria italica TaxID=4555 RepID=K3ZFN4_SETIT